MALPLERRTLTLNIQRSTSNPQRPTLNAQGRRGSGYDTYSTPEDTFSVRPLVIVIPRDRDWAER